MWAGSRPQGITGNCPQLGFPENFLKVQSRVLVGLGTPRTCQQGEQLLVPVLVAVTGRRWLPLRSHLGNDQELALKGSLHASGCTQLSEFGGDHLLVHPTSSVSAEHRATPDLNGHLAWHF